MLITVRQGVWLRCQAQSAGSAERAAATQMLDALGADVAVIEEDRRLEPDLRLLLERIRVQAWKLYE